MIAVFKGKVLHNNPTRHHKTIAKKCKVIDRWWRQFDLISFELNTETFSGMPAKTFQFQFKWIFSRSALLTANYDPSLNILRAVYGWSTCRRQWFSRRGSTCLWLFSAATVISQTLQKSIDSTCTFGGNRKVQPFSDRLDTRKPHLREVLNV